MLDGILAGSRLDHLNIRSPKFLSEQRAKLAAQKEKVRVELETLLDEQLGNEPSKAIIQKYSPGIGGLIGVLGGGNNNAINIEQ